MEPINQAGALRWHVHQHVAPVLTRAHAAGVNGWETGARDCLADAVRWPCVTVATAEVPPPPHTVRVGVLETETQPKWPSKGSLLSSASRGTPEPRSVMLAQQQPNHTHTHH